MLDYILFFVGQVTYIAISTRVTNLLFSSSECIRSTFITDVIDTNKQNGHVHNVANVLILWPNLCDFL